MAQTMEAQCDTLPRTLRKHFAVLVTDVCAQPATRASLRAGNAAAAAHTEEEGCSSDPPLPNTRSNDTPATGCSTQTCCSVQATPKTPLALGSTVGCCRCVPTREAAGLQYLLQRVHIASRRWRLSNYSGTTRTQWKIGIGSWFEALYASRPSARHGLECCRDAPAVWVYRTSGQFRTPLARTAWDRKDHQDDENHHT